MALALLTFIRYIRVDFPFGLPDCVRYNENFVISKIVISMTVTFSLVQVEYYL